MLQQNKFICKDSAKRQIVNKSTYIKVNCFSQQTICKVVNNIRKDVHKIKTMGLGLEVWVVLRFHVQGEVGSVF